MALVLLSGNITAIRGKVGGLSYQNTVAGQVVKHHCPSVNPRTLRQVKSRNIQFSLTQSWTSLTEAQRNNWQGWANYMKTHQMRNTQLFIDDRQSFLKANHNRLEYGIPLLTNPTYNKCKITPIDMNMSLIAGNLTATLNRVAVPASEFIVILASFPIPITWNNPQSTMRLVVFTTVASALQDISAEYTALYGSQPVSGDTIFFKYTNADLASGRILPFQTKKVIFP